MDNLNLLLAHKVIEDSLLKNISHFILLNKNFTITVRSGTQIKVMIQDNKKHNCHWRL